MAVDSAEIGGWCAFGVVMAILLFLAIKYRQKIFGRHTAKEDEALGSPMYLTDDEVRQAGNDTRRVSLEDDNKEKPSVWDRITSPFKSLWDRIRRK